MVICQAGYKLLRYRALSQNSRTLLDWILFILNHDTVYIDILDKLEKDKVNLGAWQIKYITSAGSRQHLCALGKSFGYLDPKVEEKGHVLTTLKDYMINNIKILTPIGYINAINFIDRLPFDPNDQDEIENNLWNKLGSRKQEEVLQKFVDALNQLTWFPHSSINSNPRSLDDWEQLLIHIQHVEPFSNPIETFSNFIHIHNYKKDICLLLSSLKPIPRSLLVEMFGIIPYSINNSYKIVEFLNRGIEEPEFWIAMLFMNANNPSMKIDWITDDFIQWVLEKKWQSAGKHVFRRIFGINYRNMRDDLRIKMQTSVNRFISRNLSKKKGDEKGLEILKSFDWPIDNEALAGWWKWTDEQSVKVSIEQWVVDEIANNFISRVKELKGDIGRLMNNHSAIDKYLPTNIYMEQSQRAYSCMIWFILHSSSAILHEWEKELKRNVFIIRSLYYGSQSSIDLAKRLSELFIFLLVSIIHLRDDKLIIEKSNQIQNMFKLLGESILYSYVRLTERRELIWNKEAFEPNLYIDRELYLINKCLIDMKAIPVYRNVAKVLFKNWKGYSTTRWPWMR